MRKREPLGYLCLDCRYEASATDPDELSRIATAHQDTCLGRKWRAYSTDTGTINADAALARLSETAENSRHELAKIIPNQPGAARELQEVSNALTNLSILSTAARHALRRK